MQYNYLLGRERQLTRGNQKEMLKIFFLMLLAGLFLTNCTTPQQVTKVSQEVQSTAKRGEQLLKELRKSPRPRTILHNEPWIAKQTIKLPAPRLPSHLNCDITLTTVEPMSVYEFSQLINKLCGVSVRITPDAQAMLSEKSSTSQGSHKQNQLAPHMITGVHWQGKLEGLLDAVATSLSLHWRYQQHAINLYYLDTRTFQLHAFPSETNVQTTVSSAHDVGGGGSNSNNKGGGQNSQSTQMSLKSNLIKDMHSSIRSMLTPKIGQLSLSTSTGSVTVTDTPEVLKRIAHYVEHENHTVTKQVLLNIKVLAVTLRDSHQLDIDWTLMYSSLAQERAKVVTLGIAPGETLTNSCLKLAGGGSFANSQIVLKALSSQGKVSVVTSPTVTTLNLQPVPIQVATQESYLARTEVTRTEKGDTVIELTPGTLIHGFSMDLIPFVMANNQLLLQYVINTSDLLELNSFGEKGIAEIQLPKISTRLFSQKVKLLSGETLVLSGFEKIQNDAGCRGPGSTHNWLLGGGINAKQQRTIIVLMITPTVMAQ